MFVDVVEVGRNIGRRVLEVELADEDVQILQGHYVGCRLQVVAYMRNHLQVARAVAHHEEVPKMMSYARHFLKTDEILLVAAAYVGAVVRDEKEYRLILVGMQKDGASCAGMLVDSGIVVASCGLLESGGMEESPYHHRHHHHHPSCR